MLKSEVFACKTLHSCFLWDRLADYIEKVKKVGLFSEGKCG